MDLEIKKYSYKQRCDMRGCSNLAEHSIGNTIYPEGQRLNICDHCYQSLLATGKPVETLIPVQEEIKEVVTKIELTDRVCLTLKELRLIARERNLTGYSNMDKESLINLLAGGK